LNVVVSEAADLPSNGVSERGNHLKLLVEALNREEDDGRQNISVHEVCANLLKLLYGGDNDDLSRVAGEDALDAADVLIRVGELCGDDNRDVARQERRGRCELMSLDEEVVGESIADQADVAEGDQKNECDNPAGSVVHKEGSEDDRGREEKNQPPEAQRRETQHSCALFGVSCR